jgi:hypothetical protein
MLDGMKKRARHGVPDKAGERRRLLRRPVYAPAGADVMALVAFSAPLRHHHCWTRCRDRFPRPTPLWKVAVAYFNLVKGP